MNFKVKTTRQSLYGYERLRQSLSRTFVKLQPMTNWGIPQSVANAMVCIYDLNGRQLKCLTVSGRGTTSVQIFGNELTAGMFHYALIADGTLVDSKTMILTE